MPGMMGLPAERGDSSRGMPGESAKGEEKVRALESKFTMDPVFCNSFFFLFVENDEDGGKGTVLGNWAEKQRGTDTKMTENIK